MEPEDEDEVVSLPSWREILTEVLDIPGWPEYAPAEKMIERIREIRALLEDSSASQE